eukprot:979726-Alexandrium_andersonii.AAC.1
MASCMGCEASSCRSATRQSRPGWSDGCTAIAISSALLRLAFVDVGAQGHGTQRSRTDKKDLARHVPLSVGSGWRRRKPRLPQGPIAGLRGTPAT